MSYNVFLSIGERMFANKVSCHRPARFGYLATVNHPRIAVLWITEEAKPLRSRHLQAHNESRSVTDVMPWTERYDVILADPPWSYYGQQDKWGAAAKFYPLMSDDDLRSLPIHQLLRPHSVLFLWATGPKLDLAMQCLSAWGLSFRGRRLRLGQDETDRRTHRCPGRTPVDRETHFRVRAGRLPDGPWTSDTAG